MISKNRAVSALMATVVTVGVLAPLAATSASADPVAISKAGCTANRSKTKDGRTLTLYQCTEGLRGQATHASPGDLVYMKNGGSTAGGVRVASGSTTSPMTGSVSGRGWTVCIAVHNRPGSDWCA